MQPDQEEHATHINSTDLQRIVVIGAEFPLVLALSLANDSEVALFRALLLTSWRLHAKKLPRLFAQLLQLANASVALNTRRNLTSSRSLDTLIRKAAEEVCRASAPVTTASELVGLASAAKRAATRGAVVSDCVQQVDAVLDGLGDRLEDVAFSQDTAVLVRGDGERVAGVVVPVVVDSVEQGSLVCAADLGAAAGGVVDVVALEGDCVTAADEEEGPVVVVIAAGGPRSVSVDLGVGDGHAVAGVVAGDDVLAADQGDLDVVDPDQVCAGEGDGVAAPDVLRVKLGDVDVLDDDVLGAGEAETFAADYTLGAFTNDGFVALDIDRSNSCGVVGDRDAGVVGVGALYVVSANS